METVASFYKHPLSLKVGELLCASVTIGCHPRTAFLFHLSFPPIPYCFLTKLVLDATFYQGYIG